MSTNISKIKREKLIDSINKIKNILNDQPELLKNIFEIENELNRKKYGLIWEEHEENVDEEIKTKIPVFVEEKKLEIKKDANKPINFLLEGDNLHSMYLLEKTHREKIRMIYIDPPYNRGSNDFIYDDNIVSKEDTYKHSKWLSFMSKRLNLAKKLMSKDSVIFISIDENECHNLKLLCDEIFNETNYVGDFIRKTKSSTNDADVFFNQQHEYCLIYKKGNFKFKGVDKNLDGYKNSDNDPNGSWKSSDPSAKSGGESTYFPIQNPITGQVDYPPQGRYWAFSKQTMEKYIKNGKIKFKDRIKKNERGFIFKSYVNQLKNNKKPIDSLVFTENSYMNQVATKEINNLGLEFDYPKPVEFIKELIISSTNKNDIILDFFAGTGTTGEAVQLLNKTDEFRQYILCTNNQNEICRNVTYSRLLETNHNDNLKYYKTGYIDRFDNEKDEYYITHELSKYITELVQLENGIDINNPSVHVIFTDEELDELINDEEKLGLCKILYLDRNAMLDDEQNSIIESNNIEICYIPEYYFAEEIMEAEEW